MQFFRKFSSRHKLINGAQDEASEAAEDAKIKVLADVEHIPV
jgi:hypothetical protein